MTGQRLADPEMDPGEKPGLWERLVELVREREIRFRWVPAGSHPHNVEADRLSREWKAEGIGTC